MENATDGLTLNKFDGHWYWGYFIGKDYAAKAFQYARDAIGSDAKLYVNDYNLETSPDKLNALIDFVKYIDANGGKVDGIGTQMHLTYNAITRDQVDAMFKTLAATGKLVRISEFDVAMGTATPSLEQYQTQSDVYKMVIESYKGNILRLSVAASASGDSPMLLTNTPTGFPMMLQTSSIRFTPARLPHKGVRCHCRSGTSVPASGDLWPNAYK